MDQAGIPLVRQGLWLIWHCVLSAWRWAWYREGFPEVMALCEWAAPSRQRFSTQGGVNLPQGIFGNVWVHF